MVSPLGPAGAPQAPYDAGAAVQGFLTGYQTMDLLASLAFGIIIAETIHELGVTDDKRVAFEISRSGVIAGVLMAIIYCGLALADMQLGTVVPDATNGAAILARSASMHFGLAGTIVVFAIFFLACMNVCIGLISCCSRYFCETYVVEGGAGASEEAIRNISVGPMYWKKPNVERRRRVAAAVKHNSGTVVTIPAAISSKFSDIGFCPI